VLVSKSETGYIEELIIDGKIMDLKEIGQESVRWFHALRDRPSGGLL
jgi:hypothetical protein